MDTARIRNRWVSKSLRLFSQRAYLDKLLAIYPLQTARSQQIPLHIHNEIIMLHQAHDTPRLLRLLKKLKKFPYDEPLWYLLKNVRGCLAQNPQQLRRITSSLYTMTAQETVIRLAAPPKLNTQMGPMFAVWLRKKFPLLPPDKFEASNRGVFLLDASEKDAKKFVINRLRQELDKRPDLVCKVNKKYVLGEAKWIGQPGGNQSKQVKEVLLFCGDQRGDVKRVGIIDGFPWAVKRDSGGRIINKEALEVQKSPYDIISALLLPEYLEQFR